MVSDKLIYTLWRFVVVCALVSNPMWALVIRGTYVTLQDVEARITNNMFASGALMQCSFACSLQRSYSLNFIKHTEACHCNFRSGNATDSSDTNGTIYAELDYVPKRYDEILVEYPRDCLDHYHHGHRRDGEYMIRLVGGVMTITWCDMDNGGWTVFQRRQDGSVNFYRNWTDYVHGFGNKSGEFWLGLDHISLLTAEPSELYIHLEAFSDVSPATAYATYGSFSVGNSSTNYKLSAGGFEGDCGDSLLHQDGMQFSTVDVDNDLEPDSCSIRYHGAWWYRSCHHSNLNGPYVRGYHHDKGIGVNWYTCWGLCYSLKKTEMKLRRL